jgi:hypothetical protein
LWNYQYKDCFLSRIFYLEDALRVVALEVSILAGDLTARVGFVASIRAVSRAVAVPGLGDAESGRVALELPVPVALIGRQRRAAQFVRAIAAVGNAIAFIRLGHALFQIGTLQA